MSAPKARGGKDLVLVGVVGAPHGVRGEVRLKSFTEDPVAAGDYGAVQAEDGRSFALTVVRALKDDMVVARIDGVADRDGAAALTHLRLFVPRDRLPAPDEDEFYTSDLVGLAVLDGAGETLGTVTAVVDYGAGDILEIARPSGGSVMLPFTKAFVPAVDVAAGRIIADPPAGVFDDTDADGGEAEAQPEVETKPARQRKATAAAAEPMSETAEPVPTPPAPTTGKGRKGSRW